jgi:3',5'-cyclic AMP phosphodiesterase CpdA
MPRIAVTSDLHYDVTGALTRPADVKHLADEMAAARPDAVVIAGDIGHPLSNFCACLDLFIGCCPVIAVLAGNHDVWRDEDHGSRALLERELPAAVRDRGFAWLPDAPVRLGGIAIAGSTAWYDYSAAEPELGKDDAFYADLKPQVSNDAHWIDWAWTDVEVADGMRRTLADQLERLERDREVESVVVVTHVPLFEEQLWRSPGEYTWSVANAYFGSLRTGREVAGCGKVSAVVSGHTHLSVRALVRRPGLPDLRAFVVGSDYGSPGWLMLEV